MITGLHALIHSNDADKLRAFLRDVLQFPSVDAGQATMKELASKGVQCGEVLEARWGTITSIKLPDGGELGLYQPKHPIALGLKAP